MKLLRDLLESLHYKLETLTSAQVQGQLMDLAPHTINIRAQIYYFQSRVEISPGKAVANQNSQKFTMLMCLKLCEDVCVHAHRQ